jgi:hypothetical protein
MVTSWPKLGLAVPTSVKDDLYHARDGSNATEARGGVAADSTRNGRAAGRAGRGPGESKRLRCLSHRPPRIGEDGLTIAERFGISESSVSRICAGNRRALTS